MSPGGAELCLSACPGLGNRPGRNEKMTNPRGLPEGGMVTVQVELNHTELILISFYGEP